MITFLERMSGIAGLLDTGDREPEWLMFDHKRRRLIDSGATDLTEEFSCFC